MDARRVKPLLVSIVALLLASPAAAQSTRVDTIAEQQAEKAKELGTEGPSDAELIIRRVLLSPLLSGGDGVYPWFGSVYGGSGMGVGVGFLKRLEKASYFNVQTGISINSSMVMRGTFAAPELWRGMLQAGCERPVARCARRVVLRFRAGLEQGHARQLRLQSLRAEHQRDAQADAPRRS